VKDTDIIHQVLGGDVDLFRLLVERYQRPVIRFIQNMIHDNHTSEDIAQDVFFIAYKALSLFDSHRSNFSTWLFVIARNKTLNFLGKKRPVLMNQIPEVPDSQNPSGNFMEKEFFDRLEKILGSLPVKQKTAFVLAEFEKLPYTQIAQIEGVRVGTVKSRINRAKKKLGAALSELDGDIL
jgi:RNA polymerase sigma-70 factor (ECF subfamily)